jgi:hypothetical protein
MKAVLQRLALPSEFRIAAPTVRLAMALPEPVGRSDEVASSASDDAPLPASAAEPPLVDESVLPDLCTGLWRLRRRMIDPGTDRPLEEMRKPFRHLESVWDTLADAGVDIRDHTNEPVPEYGSVGLDVLAYQPMPGISRERVIETVKPSIYVGERLVQMGQVIIGTPEKTSDATVEGDRT